MVFPIATKYTLAAGAAEGASPLNAFDNALLAAGVGNLNLIRVSSIIPPGARRVEYVDLPPGSFAPAAYGTLTSQTPGETIAAAVAVGVAPGGFGVIMEFAGRASRDEAEAAVRRMVEEAFRGRGLEIKEMHTRAVEHRVQQVGCVVAAVMLWS